VNYAFENPWIIGQMSGVRAKKQYQIPNWGMGHMIDALIYVLYIPHHPES